MTTATKLQAAAEDAIGPRTVGSVVFSGYWRSYSLVLEIQPDVADWRGWTITEITCDEEGTPLAGEFARTHCAPWNKRDRLVSAN